MKELTKKQATLAIIAMVSLLLLAIMMALKHTILSLLIIGIGAFAVDIISSVICDVQNISDVDEK